MERELVSDLQTELTYTAGPPAAPLTLCLFIILAEVSKWEWGGEIVVALSDYQFI